MLVVEMVAELGPHAIRVNAVSPGAVTDGTRRDANTERHIPLGRRSGAPADVAEVVTFCSPTGPGMSRAPTGRSTAAWPPTRGRTTSRTEGGQHGDRMGTLRRSRGAVARLAVAAAVAGAGCGGGSPAHRPAPATSAVEITAVLTFQAYDDAGLLPNLTATSTLAGACQGGSALVAGRADAWRCRAGDTTFDPCFANGTGEELACATDPWAHVVTVLRPAAPLGRAGSNRTDPSLPPWYLELVDGARCVRTPPATYRCAGGGADGMELGPPDTTRSLWVVAGAGVRGEVRTAWY